MNINPMSKAVITAWISVCTLDIALTWFPVCGNIAAFVSGSHVMAEHKKLDIVNIRCSGAFYKPKCVTAKLQWWRLLQGYWQMLCIPNAFHN